MRFVCSKDLLLPLFIVKTAVMAAYLSVCLRKVDPLESVFLEVQLGRMVQLDKSLKQSKLWTCSDIHNQASPNN